MTNVFNTTHKGNWQRSATFVISRKETLRETTSHWNGTTQADVCGGRINFLILRHTVITLNIGTPGPATVVVLNIKHFNFTLK